jgi:chlorite dismutase/heme-degrading monooxygenase HmoA
MVRREPPETAEGWYALHDLRTIDWTAWRDTPQRVRDRAVEEATEFLAAAADVADAAEGVSVVYAVTGHRCDLMVVHLRPTLEDVELLERRFERTELAGFTERTDSFVSVTEASGYSERAREYFEGELDEESGLAKYIRSRLYPRVPDHEYVSFYPMDKRRQPDQNWYDLPFEERAEHVDNHGDIGRDYAGQVEQMITGAIGMDDWEWGVTLWTDDLTDVKDLLYEMRFDPSTSQYADFGPFYVGRRLPPADLGAYLAGERVPTDGHAGIGADSHPTGEADAQSGTDDQPVETGAQSGTDDQPVETGAQSTPMADGDPGGPPVSPDDGDVTVVDDVDRRLAEFGVTPTEYDDGDHGLVCYVDGTAEDVVDDIEGLRENFDHYDTHVLTGVRANQGEAAVVSVWETERAATTAAGFLTDVDAVSRTVRGTLGDSGDADSPPDDAEGSTGDGADGAAGTGEAAATEIRADLADEDVYAGQPHGEDVYALVLYSRADPDELVAAVENLRDGFDRYDTHVGTAVYSTDDGVTAVTDDGGTGPDADDVAAVVSLWKTADAADTAADFLTDLPEVVGRPADREGFTTLGMFYTVKSDYRTEFVETFDEVGAHLTGMDGHRETALLVNREDEDDMFIASRWDEKESAMTFFRSEAFRETVDWGRDVLADEPRHVFFV